MVLLDPLLKWGLQISDMQYVWLGKGWDSLVGPPYGLNDSISLREISEIPPLGYVHLIEWEIAELLSTSLGDSKYGQLLAMRDDM